MVKRICIPGARKIFVDVNGNFYPCEKVGEANQFIIGRYDKGLEYRKVIDLIDKYISMCEDCKSCWAMRLCGLCFASARKGSELSRERKKERCTGTKSRLHNSLVMYASIMEKNPEAFKFLRQW